MTADIKKIEGIIESEFEMQKFVSLISEIFPSAKAVSPYKVQREFSNFSSHIVGCSHVANYKTSDNKQVLIFAVELKKDFFVENSRSTQRSYAKKLIENGNADAAIIAFHTAGNPRWRLSFVRLGYEMKFEESKLKSVEKLTPARRYSFLVGKDEPSHTAIERLQFIAVVRNGMPTLDELEEAFSVEKVTKEFFELYCEKYQELHDFLIQNKDFIIESENCGFTAEQFAKKLMGQIVFLYFLQKKGWLGVNVWPDSLSEKEFKDVYCTGGVMGNKIREHLPQLYVKRGNEYRRQSSVLDTLPEDVEEAIANNLPKNKTGAWGEGSKKFLRTVYDFAMRHNANFYNDYLEPLFYNTLNRYRGDMGYCQLLHCRIPFLSGGLFEPIKGYDWKNSVLNIPNEIFSNKQGADGTTGDGILDIFDRYNFTMSEDEPLEREVAIDPEMLGKVFENLLDIKDRKSKGAFYTPREIVHYMCQESLIKYLVNSTGLSEDGIRDFILYGDFMKDEDTVKEKRLGNSGMYIADDIFKIDSKGNITADRLKDIDDALVNIRVCDPAVGSGAFPVGMLNEIVRARQNLTEYMAVAEKIRVGEAQAKHTVYTLRSNRTPYILKRNAIKNSIFAVDIEPSAVDIAQLRLWLSLVIDDEINPEASSILEGHRNPTPLPNLECNILCGNSLKDKFDGKPLLNYSNLICRKTDVQHIDMAWAEFEDMLPKLFDIQDKIFSCDNPERKVEYLKQLESIKHTMLKLQLYGITYEQWNRFVETEEMASKPYILWQLDFARVFREKGGFDVVIGNPPYIQLQLATGGPNDEKFGDLYIDEGFDTFVKKGDIFCLFYEKGLQLLREGGILTFITSNKWMRTEYGEKLRGYLAKYNPVLLIDFAGQKIFETATVDVNILLIEKISNKGATTTCVAQEGCRKNLSEFIKQNHCIQEFNSSDLWVILSPIEQCIMSKIESKGVPLKEWNITIYRGVLTGYNDAFIINEDKKNELIAEDPKSADIIRPILRGRNVQRYGYTFANQYIILAKFGSYEYLESKYPAIYHHLSGFKEELQNRGQCRYTRSKSDNISKPYPGQHHWLELDNNPSDAFIAELSKPKIIWKRIGSILRFAYDSKGLICLDSTCFAVGKHIKYLTAVLNSYIGCYMFRNSPKTGTGDLIVSVQAFEPVRVPVPSLDQENEINILLDKIIADTDGKNTKSYEDQIESMLVALFGFSIEEHDHIVEYVQKNFR